MSKRETLSALGLGGLLPLLQGCSVLSAFNAFAPKEKESKLVAADVQYGEGPRRRYDVYAPVRMDGPAPVVVFFYGGGWNSGAKDLFSWAGRALAALGYVVALPDYRLVPDVRFPAFVEDSAAAVRHVMENAAAYNGDAKRMALMGHSAGAYNAMMLTLDPKYLKFGPDEPNPIKAAIGIAGPYDFYPFDIDLTREAMGYWPKPEETQPITYARKVSTKILLLHSRGDTLVGVHNVLSLDQKLKKAGASVQMIIYDKPSHSDIGAALSLPLRGLAPTMRDVRRFLAENL